MSVILKLLLFSLILLASNIIPSSFVLGFPPTLQQILSHPRFDLAAEDDYIDEITNGHRIRDMEKYEREKDCMCLKHMKDPHCGSDGKEYDNGCFFLCAQERQKGLRLKRWGNCEDDDDLDKVQEDVDFEDLNNTPMGFVEV